MFAVGAIFLLAQSGAGVTTFAEGRAGTVMTIPATASNPLVIYAIPTTGPLEMDCHIGAASAALVGPNFGMSATRDGQTLKPRQDLTSWRAGDTFTCTGTGFQQLVLGHNDGLTHLLQGLLAAAGAVGGSTLGLLGFAARRYQRRA